MRILCSVKHEAEANQQPTNQPTTVDNQDHSSIVWFELNCWFKLVMDVNNTVVRFGPHAKGG